MLAVLVVHVDAVGASSHRAFFGAYEDDARVRVALHPGAPAARFPVPELVARILTADSQCLLVGLIVPHPGEHRPPQLGALLIAVARVTLAAHQLAGEEIALAVVEDVARR